MDENYRRKRDKAWRGKSPARRQKRQEDVDAEEQEMLRIQGLTRCSKCMITYPYHFDNCPQCEEPNIS